MKLKKLYKHDNGKQLWRILPTESGKVVVEERESKTKEVYFSCFEIESGKKILNEFQLEEKNWIGIESIYNELIFFHAYRKPDMPAHKSIIAFNLSSKSIIWRNNDYVFSFIYDDKVYCYQQRFESRVFFALDYLTGNVLEDFGSDVSKINHLKEKADGEFEKFNYTFPEYYTRNENVVAEYQKYLDQIRINNVIKGEINYLKLENLLMFNYHEISKVSTISNVFIAVDLTKNKILLKEILDKNLINLMPESFFIKGNLLFLISDKTKLIVYQIIH